ncbi:HNH endonuclease [Janibacter terrae]|uniref:HNH endonuclease n=1 Tax=Janibacter terrae TaxID=103817 RepID=UPI0037FA202B
MRRIGRPDFHVTEIFDEIGSRYGWPAEAALADIRAAMVHAESRVGALIDGDFEPPTNALPPGTSKSDYVSLYDTHLVRKESAGRKYYDRLRKASLKCAYCQSNEADTLDHYFEKAQFGLTSIVPLNLVPACQICNKKLTGESYKVFPYFEDLSITQWLGAEVLSDPLSAVFHVKSELAIDDGIARRLRATFDRLEFASRLWTTQSSQIHATSRQLATLATDEDRLEHLAARISGFDDLNDPTRVVLSEMAKQRRFR